SRATPGPAADPFPALPAEFGRYRVLKLLGKGGMVAVYLAQDSQLGRLVALKLPSFDASESPERADPRQWRVEGLREGRVDPEQRGRRFPRAQAPRREHSGPGAADRKSTRLNSSH